MYFIKLVQNASSEIRNTKAINFNNSILLIFHPKYFSALLFCCVHWILTEFFTLMQHDSHVCTGVSCKSNMSVFIYLQKSHFQGWWNKVKSERINFSNCQLQQSMKVSGSRILHKVLQQPNVRDHGERGASDQCHMNKLSEMGNVRRNKLDSSWA